MGSMQAMELASSGMPLEQQIAIHFAGNCYPPIPSKMIPVAVAAIEAYQELDFARVIQLPEGVEFRNGESWVFASQAIESLRLDAWLQEIYWTEEDEE
jgi:hypothetical protein